jgi:hypothetical protein
MSMTVVTHLTRISKGHVVFGAERQVIRFVLALRHRILLDASSAPPVAFEQPMARILPSCFSFMSSAMASSVLVVESCQWVW